MPATACQFESDPAHDFLSQELVEETGSFFLCPKMKNTNFVSVIKHCLYENSIS